MGQNRHPVDELADVRAEMRRLKDREAELRQMVLTKRCSLVGDDFEAVVTNQHSQRLDVVAAREALGLDVLGRFMRESDVAVVKVRER